MLFFSSRLQKRKLKSIVFYVGGWAFFCLLFAFFHFYGLPDSKDPILYLSVLQFAILAGLSHGIYDVIVLRDDRDSRPILTALCFRLTYFASIVLVNLSLCIFIKSWYSEGEFFSERSFEIWKETFAQPSFQSFAFYGILCGFFITFIRSVNKKFGSNVFINSVLGKTQDPQEMSLIFMFVDLRRSTHLAEEMGHVKYSRFMKEYYRLLSNCCEENDGDIYQIAGDGVFLTWPLKSCKKSPKPILCFEDLKLCFFRTRKRFIAKFGAYPTFKAAAHSGRVTMTEVGNFRSEIAYHGDAVNTTSRLQDLCSKLGEEFLISEKLLSQLPGLEAHTPELKGTFELKGKSRPTSVYALHFSDDVPTERTFSFLK